MVAKQAENESSPDRVDKYIALIIDGDRMKSFEEIFTFWDIELVIEQIFILKCAVFKGPTRVTIYKDSTSLRLKATQGDDPCMISFEGRR